MIRIAAEPITNLPSLKAALQNALRLEFFTIPPYLTALYTLKGSGAGVAYARSLIRNIVRDEMLHMNLVCNIMNAVGGAPDIRGAVPTYPNPLPMALAGELQVHLKRYSRVLVKSVFMEIEKPETPLDIPVKAALTAAAVAGPQTIGEFYGAIKNVIWQEGDALFTGDRQKQVTMFFTSMGGDLAVVDRNTAVQAIDIIVEQGEGTPQSPVDLQDDIAHYYRFQELAKGMKLIAVPTPHFDSAQPIVIDETAEVVHMVDDPQTVTIDPADAAAKALADDCDRMFRDIVNALHTGYNGTPTALADIDTAMTDLRGTIRDLLGETLTVGPNAGLAPGPRFLYMP